MKFISESKELSETDLVGGKGAHLQKLVSWGAPVPPFFVLTTDCFRQYHASGKLPEGVAERFREFFKYHPKIALRSSMIAEDNVDSSFAGLFETLLDVTESSWEASLHKIYQSVKSDRVTEYITRKNLKVDLQMAVVAQKLIEVGKSGVLFTRSPIDPTGAVAIDAAFGMGEGVVSGHADVDHYQYTRTLDLITARYNNRPAVLNADEAHRLIKLGIQMEEKIGTPSDIEWGYKDGELYLFQIRPITRQFEDLKYFVDTNLSESYPGVVSPLTASFVKKAYENVFSESAQIMGARTGKLSDLKTHYKNLICCVDDHLYYNLEHYYAALRSLPGGEKNITNWHRMIGGKMEGLSIPYHSTELSGVETVSTIKNLVSLSLGRKKVFEPFIKDLEKLKLEIEREMRAVESSKEMMLLLDNLINRPLGFGLTVVNDIFIMMGLGYLSKALKKKGIPEDRVIDLLRTSEGVESVKPLEHFNHLVKNLSPEFIDAFSKSNLELGFDPFGPIFEDLIKKGFEKDVKLMKDFLALFGDRSFEELKLESLPMKNNPFLVNQLINWAKNNPSSVHKPQASSIQVNFSWLENKILNFTRESIATRESARLWRGKFYHLLRHLILNIGVKLKEEDLLFRGISVQDLFSVNHHEWREFAEGKRSNDQILGLMNSRKAWQTKKKHFPEIIPWVENDPLPELNLASTSEGLSGQGVSSGIVEGTALVLDKPNEAFDSDLKDFILVTKNTDPAWVYIMSRSKGLVSEKGSLLSHTAIIGRELNIPTIVGVKMATQIIPNGARIRIDATKGTIEII